MRVLFLTHAYPRSDADPVGSFVANLASALADRGIEVVVSAPSAPGLVPLEVLRGIPVHRFRYAPRRFETLAYTGTMGAQVRESFVGKLAMVSYLAAAGRAARALARREAPDLIHAHWWFPGGLVASSVSRAAGVPFLVTMHGSDLRLAARVPFARTLYGRVARRASAMTAVSTWLARDAEALEPARSVTVAPMPVLDRLFHPGRAHEPDLLLFVGKLTEQKGLARLLRAMTRMQRPARLAVVGAGRVDDSALRASARELGLADRIEWLPLLSQAKLGEQYRRAAIHVVPALDEGLGLTAVESLLSETPVVGFRSGGLPDIVPDGIAGRLVPPGDETALAAALDEVLADDAGRRRMGVAGRAHAAQRFGAAGASERYVALYEQVLADHARRVR